MLDDRAMTGPTGAEPHYHLRPARADEVERIQEIEQRAAQRFAGLGLIDHALDEVSTVEELRQAAAEARAWVVCTPDGVAVGYARAEVRGGLAYLEEMDVLPEHGRRGLGGRLVEAVCAWAHDHHFPAVTLTTFRDVPWNGPFYEKLGFRPVAPEDWGPEMAAIHREEEEEMKLPWAGRAFYQRQLSPPWIASRGSPR
jgi:GNAT superfamily N-acetyltransferase